jgi:hypothetical protein
MGHPSREQGFAVYALIRQGTRELKKQAALYRWEVNEAARFQQLGRRDFILVYPQPSVEAWSCGKGY